MLQYQDEYVKPYNSYSYFHNFPSFYLDKYCAMQTLVINNTVHFLFIIRHFHSSSFEKHI